MANDNVRYDLENACENIRQNTSCAALYKDELKRAHDKMRGSDFYEIIGKYGVIDIVTRMI